MAQYVSLSEKYYREALFELVSPLVWDQIVSRDGVVFTQNTAGAMSATAKFAIYDIPDANVNPLPSSGSASTTVSPDANYSEISLHEYGEGVIPVTALASFSDPNNYPAVAVKQSAGIAAKSLNALGRTAGISSIPAAGSYTNGSFSIANVQTADLVYLGTASTSKTARNLITSAETLTADWVDKGYERLRSRGAKPVAFADDGTPLYAAICSRKVWLDLKADSGSNSLMDQVKYTAVGGNIISFNSMGTWAGFIWIEDPNSVYSGAGDSGIDIYPVVFAGKEFLGKSFLTSADLPLTEGEAIEMYEGVQIRVIPAHDTHARQKNVVWYGFLGYGVVNPYASFRLEVASAH